MHERVYFIAILACSSPTGRPHAGRDALRHPEMLAMGSKPRNSLPDIQNLAKELIAAKCASAMQSGPAAQWSTTLLRFQTDNDRRCAWPFGYIDVVRTRLPTGSSKHNDNGKGPVLAPARGGQPLNSPPPAQLRSPNNATQVKRFFTCKLRLPNSRPAAQLATSSKAGLERTTDIFLLEQSVPSSGPPRAVSYS